MLILKTFGNLKPFYPSPLLRRNLSVATPNAFTLGSDLVKFKAGDFGTNTDAVNVTLKQHLSECYNVADVCKVYKSLKDSLNPTSLAYVLSRIVYVSTRPRANTSQLDLWPATDLCPFTLDKRIGRVKIVDLDKRVLDLYTRVLAKLDFFTVEQLCYLARFGKCIKGYHNQVIQTEAERRVMSELEYLEPLDLCRVASTFCIASSNVEFLKVASQVIISKLIQFEPNQRLHIFQIMGGLRHCACFFLENATRAAVDESLFSGPAVVKILACYAAKPSISPPALVQKLFNRCLALDLSTLTLQEGCDLIYVSSKYSQESHLLFEPLQDLIKEKASNLSVRNLAMLIWAYGETNFTSDDMLQALEAAAILKVDCMTPSQLALVSHALALKMDNSGKFHEHSEPIVVKYISHFNGLDLSMLAAAYAKLGAGTLELRQTIKEALLKYTKDLPADCLARVLHSYATFGGSDESLFQRLKVPVLQRIHQFHTRDLCKTLWSFAVAKQFNTGFWNAALDFIQVDKVLGDGRCAILYPALVAATQAEAITLNPHVTRLLNVTEDAYNRTHENQNSTQS